MPALPLRLARSPDPAAEVSHNLVGQRLGRKGLETRERILSAALRLLEGPGEAAITLSGVARHASVGMTTLYLYFPDLGDLVLAALGRVMDLVEAAFLSRLRTRWPDDRLEACCLDFLHAHHRFWAQHARLLHMRNSLADACDMRLLDYRYRVSRPLVELLVAQMDGHSSEPSDPSVLLATVLLTGIERVVSVVTNPNFHLTAREANLGDQRTYVSGLLAVEAELITGAIRGKRTQAKEVACIS